MRRLPEYLRRLQKNPDMQAPSLRSEFIKILFWGGGGCLIIYLVLGLAGNGIVPHVSPQADQYLGKLIVLKGKSASHPKQEKLQELLIEMLKVTPETKDPFEIKIIAHKSANAIAYPGNRIVVTTALLDEIQSENELAFILGHELGHFINRDHLRGLGRVLLFYFATVMLFGNDNALVDFFGKVMSGAEMKFSQKQELQADLWALELLKRKYGHAGGATDFFQRLAEGKARGKKMQYYFSIHPHPEKRIQRIKETAAKRGYLAGK